VYRLAGGQTIVQTVDFFTPVVDDPRLFGAIAAANSLSDVYAMRGRPLVALALVAFPTKVLPSEVLEGILRGGAEKVAEAGAVIAGGHSIDHDVPLYGLSVTGVVDENRITRNRGAVPGDALVLTKPLGVGITVRAARADTADAEKAGDSGAAPPPRVRRESLDEAIRVMAMLNRAAMEAMEGFDVHAATDVTGYGLLGHAHEMMDASGTTAQIAVGAVPLLAQARELAGMGMAPGGSRDNARNLTPRTDVGEGVGAEDLLLLADAQTSGGLLVALPEDQAEDYAARARELGAPAGAVVGRVLARGEKLLRVTR
jgi:selenide, water dikinase